MINRRTQRALELTEWAARPMRWAARFAHAPSPFKRLRRLPFKALCRVVEFQLLLLNK